jgi:hypothetical protein
MKKFELIKIIITEIVLFSTVLLCFCFVEGNINVFQWAKGERLIMLSIWIILMIPAVMWVYNDQIK